MNLSCDFGPEEKFSLSEITNLILFTVSYQKVGWDQAATGKTIVFIVSIHLFVNTFRDVSIRNIWLCLKIVEKKQMSWIQKWEKGNQSGERCEVSGYKTLMGKRLFFSREGENSGLV